METAIISLFSMVIILMSTLTMTQGTLSSVNTTADSLLRAEERVGEIRRTDLALVSVSVQGSGTLVDITLGNQGEVALHDFRWWDVIVKYRGSDDNYYIKWLPYTSGAPGDNQWTKTGIYLTATSDPEVFEPGIFNPEEEMVLQIKLNPAVKVGSTNLIEVVTPNGVVIPVVFNG